MDRATVLIVGGTSGLGRDLARHYTELGRHVTITGRDLDRARAVAAELGDTVGAVAFDLGEPATIAPALSEVGAVDRLALVALERDVNDVRHYDVAAALRLVTLKLVGYTEVVHALTDRLADDAAVLVYGGLAKLRPYPGSTTVTTVNAGVDGIVRALVTELAPVRINAIHPGIVADSPFWESKDEALEAVLTRTPSGRLVQMRDISEAAAMLLENPSINGTELRVDGGWSLP
ncbi:MAG TPA: SDR family oxidoreductase [Actinomycetota bacterium]|nr:SDR family oxidoreductase [Actinomycetota bacterium]